ncbi:hypothetical protein O181_031830 [Austropuccinia psidii MF-1]|uniref:Uncharacterized protein n=1 Tax=Austropuccinia psidii MF-1 TaxID=1389203 RepID=A0A9Q3H7M8_9BASI|nr:hypothetical protein [Austropuccinia psidii MF-1]
MSSTTSTLRTNSTAPQTISPQLLFNTQSNDLPYSLPSTIVEPPVPSTIPLETPLTPQLLLRNKFPTLSYLNIHQISPPVDLHNVHPLTPTNDIIQEELHVSIAENNSSPNVPSQIPSNTTTPINATTPHVVSSPMQINHVKSSHTLSALHFENPENNLLTSQSNPSTPSHAPTPGIRDPSNHLSHVGPSPPVLHEPHQNPLDSPNDQFSIFTDKFQSKFYELFKTFTHGHLTQAKYQTTFEAIDSLVSWHHQNLGSKQPEKGNFNFKQCSSSYRKWIDMFCDNSAPFLNATKDEFYVTSSIFKIWLYEQVTAPEIQISLPFSPNPSICNEKNPETHFVHHLIYMLQPRSFTITAWAKVIAASVSATMD